MRLCEYCKKKPLPPYAKRFCSMRCHKKYEHTRSEKELEKASRPCGYCKKLVQRYPSQFAQGRGKYCSKACMHQRRSEEGRATRTCQQCKRKFTIEKKRIQFRPAKFCSRQCSDKALENHEMRLCFVCGSPFKVIPYRSKTAKCCSKNCRNILRLITGQERGLRKMIYTPGFLRMLRSHHGIDCGFSIMGCMEPKSTNSRTVWNSCRKHNALLTHALGERRRRREKEIAAHSETIERKETYQ